MTITVNDTRNEYTASAGQTVFNYTFKIFADTDLNVYLTSAGTNPDDATDLITAYTVSGVGNEDGGTITLTTPASAGDLITIVSDIPESRTTDYQNNGDFRPSVVNDDFDRVVSLVKQAVERSNRGLAFQESAQGVSGLDLPTPEAGYFLRWNGALSGLENVPFTSQSPGSDSLTVSSLANVTDADTGDWRYVLGKSTIGDGGHGVWVLKTGDFTAQLAVDILNGIYLPYSGEDGSTRAWVRQFLSSVNIRWTGANPSLANNRSEIQGALDIANYLGRSVDAPNGTYLIKPETTLGRLLLIRGTDVVIRGESQEGTVFKVAATDEDGNVMHDAGGTTDPNGYVAMFTPTVGNDDVSRFRLENLTVDLNAEDNHLVRGYGNEPGVEPLEGVYPGSSEIYLARFRAAVYILVGDDISFEKVTIKNPQRVGVFCDGSSIYGDIKRATATNCKVEITVTNPGTNDWDAAGVLLIGDSCACLNSSFVNTSGGTDFYLARTAMEITGPGARIQGNYVDGWHRIALIGNSALDSIANTIVCSDNVGINVNRSIQLLARAGVVITSGEPAVGIIVANNSAKFTLSMELNTPINGDLTGIGMHEIESLGLDSILIEGNINIFPEGATYGGSGVHISPIGTGTQNIYNLSIKNNITINPPTNGIQVSFADTVENFVIEGNETTNPGQVATASDREKAGVLVRGLMKRGCVNGNKLFDDRVSHVATAGVWFTPSTGSNKVEALDTSIFLADGVYDIPVVEVENANLSPVITGITDTFVAPTWYAGTGSKVVETSSYFTYHVAVNNLWYPEIAKGLSIALVTFPNGDTTPSAKGMSWARANNTAGTTITDFDDPYEGQKLTILFTTGNTTIQHGTNIFTKTGANVTPAANTTMNFLYVNSNWYEI